MDNRYRKIIFIVIIVVFLIIAGVMLYRYLMAPVTVQAPPEATTTPPVTQIPPTPIVSGPFKPIALTCTKDDGVRWQEGDFVNYPSIVQLDDGRYRLYYDTAPYVIKSAISTDGVNFTSEGVQKEGQPDTEEVFLGSPSVIKIGNQFRMYYQASAVKPNGQTKFKIFTGLSGNGLNFSGEGSVIEDTASTFGAKNPKAVLLPGGQIRLYYLTSQGIKSALSTDGINFTPDSGVIITGATSAEVIELATDHYLALCATTPGSNPSLETIRTLNSQNPMDFAPKACGQGSVALKTSTPFDFWGMQAPSALVIGDMIKVFYQGYNVEPKLGGGSVIVSASCSIK